MMCDRCRARVAALKPRRKRGWRYDPLMDAIVWEDEFVALCVECSHDYQVALNVRTQLLMGETPSPEFQATYERFRQAVPDWIGFGRTKLTREQRKAAQGPRDVRRRRAEEMIDDD